MKFKTLFSLFNVVILVSFSFIFLMPLPVLGWEYAMSFWAQNWLIAVVFVGILAALDTYFLLNWKMFRLLEREDWEGLRSLLEAEIARKGTLSLQKTRIFLNACLIGQVPSRISHLREIYVTKNVRFLPKVALSLGLPLVLEGKADAIEMFFAPFLDQKKGGPDQAWIRWCVAFARLLKQDADGARPLLEAGLSDKKQPLLQLLSLYLYDNLRHRGPEVAATIDREKAVLARRFTAKEWSVHIESLKDRVILVLFMEKLMGEARQWLETPPKGASE